MVSDGGKIGDRLRPAWGPRFSPEIVEGEFRDPVHGMEQANPRMPGGRNFSLRLGRPLHGPLHVRLARRHPHVADQDVLEDDLVGSPDGQIERSAGGARRKIEAKLAQGIRRGRFRLTAEARRDNLAGVRLAPHMHGLFALDHHVIGQQGGHLHRGMRRAGRETGEHDGSKHHSGINMRHGQR